MKLTDNNKIATAKVKVYEKTYKRKNKYGKQSTVKTVQKLITLNKNAPFNNNDAVIIVKDQHYYQLLEKTEPVENAPANNDITVAEMQEQLDIKENEIRKLNELTQEQLKLINDLTADLRIANEINTSNNIKLTSASADLSKYKEQIKNNEHLLNILIAYAESLINQSVNTAVKNTITEINNELKETNIIQRLKGLKIVKEPAIDKEKITADAVEKINNAINNNNLLEW